MKSARKFTSITGITHTAGTTFLQRPVPQPRRQHLLMKRTKADQHCKQHKLHRQRTAIVTRPQRLEAAQKLCGLCNASERQASHAEQRER